MPAISPISPPSSGSPPRLGHRSGLALAVIAVAQLMVVLDATIVNVALPGMQRALGFSAENLSWVVSAYTLSFGGLLLLGGRIGDVLGRRRALTGGVLLFTLASLLGGLARSAGWLLSMRVLQGAGAAVTAPAILALIATTFRSEKQRNQAFGVYAVVSGAGAAVGLLAGGLLTEWVSWRWVLLVNVPIGVTLVLLVPLVIAGSPGTPGRFDLSGALTSAIGTAALVYGFIHASQQGWRNWLTAGSFAAAAVLLAVFAAIESRAAQPITPLRLFTSRNRVGTYIIGLTLTGSLVGLFYFLTLLLQDALGYTPVTTGAAFLPVSLCVIVAAGLMTKLLPRIGPKIPLVSGTVLITAALAWLSTVSGATGYLTGLLGPLALYGIGMGMIFMPMTMLAVSGVAAHDTGAASGLLSATQQAGGALGLAILVTVFGAATSRLHGTQALVLTMGAPAGLRAAAGLAAAALAVAVTLIRPARADLPMTVPGQDAGDGPAPALKPESPPADLQA